MENQSAQILSRPYLRYPTVSFCDIKINLTSQVDYEYKCTTWLFVTICGHIKLHFAVVDKLT